MNSAAIYEASLRHMPGGVNSPVRSFRSLEMDPLIAERGEGALLWDADGRRLIDFCMSWGSLIHGHAHPAIVRSATEQMERGSSFGAATRYELELAERIKKSFPSIEKIRFVSSGTEATMTAVRIARAATRRDRIVMFSGNYHGHHDALLGERSAGIPKSCCDQTIVLPYNDISALQTLSTEIAAVIIEPIAANMGVVPATEEFLQQLRVATRHLGIMLIFDEVVTGFRVAKGGAQGVYQIAPDLTCLGKIIGGGFPAAAVGGKAELMNLLAPLGPVYQAGTLSGNPVAMRAGLSSLSLLEEEGFYARLQEKTEAFLAPIRKKVLVQSFGSMFTLFFGVDKVENFEDASKVDKKRFAQFFRELFARGVYLAPMALEASFISMAHTDAQLEEAQTTLLKLL